MKNILIYSCLLMCFSLGLNAQHAISGDITLPNALPICDVLVSLEDASGTIVAQDVSNADGTYLLENIPTGNDYVLKFSKDGSPLNGVSTFDLVLVSRWILGIDNSQPYMLWIADVNGSGTISTLDMILMRKVILAIDTDFMVPAWRFDDPNAMVPNETIEIPVLNADLDQPVIGVKTGDVNGSANLSGC